VCDDEGDCATATVSVRVLAVNDAPRLRSADAILMVATEDDDTMLAASNMHYEVDDVDQLAALTSILDATKTAAPPRLLLTITTPPRHGTARPHSAYGLIAYAPDPDYVGDDNLTYTVCDQCAGSRDKELGRVAPSTDPRCVRERTRIGTSGATPGCLTVSVAIKVVNTNDPVVVRALSATTSTNRTVVFHPFLTVSDVDTTQYAQLVAAGKDPADYGLMNADDIDYRSLSITAFERASIVREGDRPSIVYSSSSALGYEEFYYTVCDLGGDCATALVHVLVSKAGPAILAVERFGACEAADGTIDTTLVGCGDLQTTDASYGAGDKLVVRFSEATNMPPGKASLDRADVDALLAFTPRLSRTDSPAAYTAYWLDPAQLVITVQATGFPEPALRSGGFRVAVRPVDTPCASFTTGASGEYLPAQPGEYCLLDAAQNSLHSDAVSSVLLGNFGLQLPTINRVIIGNPPDVESTYFGVGTVAEFIFEKPAFGTQQLVELCKLGTEALWFVERFGAGFAGSTECSQQLADGTVVPASGMSQEEADCLWPPTGELTEQQTVDCAFEVTGGGGTVPRGRRRRTLIGDSPVVASTVKVVVTSLTSAAINLEDTNRFLMTAQSAWRLETAAEIASADSADSSGNSTARQYLQDLATFGYRPSASSGVTIRGSAVSTPRLVAVAATGAVSGLTAGDQLTLSFSVETNMPSGNVFDRSLSRADVDRLLTFTPALGASDTGEDYAAVWLDRKTLVITVSEPNTRAKGMQAAPQGLEIGFPLHNSTADPDPDPCTLLLRCGTGGPTWGICNQVGSSCRTSGAFKGADITGAWNSDDLAVGGAATSSDMFYLLILFIPIILLIMYLMRRHYKKKAQKKEISRIVRAWRTKFTPQETDAKAAALSDKALSDTAEAWPRPEGMVAMRSNPDPFLSLAPPVTPGPRASVDMAAAFGPRASASIAPTSGMALPGGRADVFSRAGGLPPLKTGPGGGVPMRMPPLQSGGFAPGTGGGAARPSRPSFAGPSMAGPSRPSFAGPAAFGRPGQPPDFAAAAMLARAGVAFSKPRTLNKDNVDPFKTRRQSAEMKDPFARPSMNAPVMGRPAMGSMPKRPSMPAAPLPGDLPPLRPGQGQGTNPFNVPGGTMRPHTLPALDGGTGRQGPSMPRRPEVQGRQLPTQLPRQSNA